MPGKSQTNYEHQVYVHKKLLMLSSPFDSQVQVTLLDSMNLLQVSH